MHSNLYIGARYRKFQLWGGKGSAGTHKNQVREKWMLAEEPHKYKYSSASYYHTGVDEFGFLENYMNACDEDEW